MKSRNKTSLAILRSTLGPVAGSEFSIGKKTGLSTSWILKASAGITPITRKAAAAICDATGIGFHWLMANNPTVPPVDNDGKPYTVETYESFKLDRHEYDYEASFEIPLALHEILSALAAAKEKGKPGAACVALYEFAELLKARFGQSENVMPLLKKVNRQIVTYLTAPKGGKYRVKRRQPSQKKQPSPSPKVQPKTKRKLPRRSQAPGNS